MERFHKITSASVVLLGVIHVAMTPVFFEEFSMRVMWYVAQGLMAIFLGFLNFAAVRARWNDRVIVSLCLWANGLALAFVVLYSRVDRSVPSYVAIALVGFVSFSALRLARSRLAAKAGSAGA